MPSNPQPPRIHLPKGWQDCVKSAVLHAIALAHYAIVYARALLREELRIKDTRIAQIAPQRRPHYGPHERMAILELRAARGWSLKQTADTFLVTSATIASWLKRIDDQGANALLQPDPHRERGALSAPTQGGHPCQHRQRDAACATRGASVVDLNPDCYRYGRVSPCCQS